MEHSPTSTCCSQKRHRSTARSHGACGGWQISLVEQGEDAGEFIGHKQPRRPQIISRGMVLTAVTALKQYRRLSPAQLISVELSKVGDVVSDDYMLAGADMSDDYGFVLQPGAGYRRIVRTIANCSMTHIWSPQAAFAWSKGLRGMGALAETVDRVRRLEVIGLGADG